MNLAAFRDKEEQHADLLLSAHEMKVCNYVLLGANRYPLLINFSKIFCLGHFYFNPPLINF